MKIDAAAPATPEGFLDARIGDAGNAANLFRARALAKTRARAEIVADDLDIDRRRRAEIEDMADDIGREERECRAGKGARQLFRAIF